MQKSGNKKVTPSSGSRQNNSSSVTFIGSIGRTTVRIFKNLPNRIRNFFQRKYKEAQKRPKRKDINRVYYLVGYTTKEKVDAMYSRERSMIILRRGLLTMILILLLLIALGRITENLDLDSYSQMFGVSDTSDLTRRDPFSNASETTEEDDNSSETDVVEIK